MNRKAFQLSGLSVGSHNSPINSDSSYIPKRNTANLIFIAVFIIVLALFLYASWDHLVPATTIQSTPAIAVKSLNNYTPKGQTAFQAAGWLEPAPSVTKVSTLVSGTVKKVTVIEGQAVKKGDTLAVLIAEDLQLDLQQAEAELVIMEKTIAASKAILATATATLKHQDAHIKTAKAELAKVENEKHVLHRAGRAIPKIQKEQAVHTCDIKKAVLEAAKMKKKILEAELAERRAMVEAEEAKLLKRLIDIKRIKLDLARTKIISPIDGVIMRLHACVGSNHIVDSDEPNAAVIAELFRPDMLQVRADVPLADAGKLSVGQEAIIELEILPEEKFQGKVSSIAGIANLQRNTLQAKVKIENPSVKLRPEMLARIRFQSIVKNNLDHTDTTKRVSVFIPENSIRNINKQAGHVWIFDRKTDKARKASVTIGHIRKENWVEIKSGVKPGQLIITSDTSALKEGMRVKNQKPYRRNSNDKTL